MHSLIGIIEEANDPDCALVFAEEFLQSRMPSQIDYYVMCDDEDFRWDEYPKEPVDVSSKKGKKLVKELIKDNKREIDYMLEKIKQELNKDNPDYEYLFYYCRMASGSLMNGHLFLNGDPVVSWSQIEKYLAQKEGLYLVLADVHT